MHSRCTQPAMPLNDTRSIFMLLVALWVVRLVLMPFISGTTFGGDTLDSTFKQLLNRCDSFFSDFMSIQHETIQDCPSTLSSLGAL
ncbi:uncharacterized protein BJ212DRAFT_1470412 [Suillus subaureus]|uniref:Uncharacterized protein n=1 Tax=Suillus subaureus TaxID=48587 RepID=A0A9P7J3Q0_9AGAM|nr:uncharacterized protein BJ212DRAFT_1470412 [Suillus subaureus]KAG1801192.1 hypothetical protein BJ212DRAFT_1470412 [Suillus subaureus]